MSQSSRLLLKYDNDIFRGVWLSAVFPVFTKSYIPE